MLPDGHDPLTRQDAHALFGRILDGEIPHENLATLLITMADRGETAEELAGAAQAMRDRMLPVCATDGAIDVCGTGGDGSHSLNVSTAVAIVVAACGVPVAKHGNRAASSLAGGADTLEALGLDLARASDAAEDTLGQLGIAFLFAQKHHPALAPLAPLRRSLGRRTIFNLLGPLANPANVKRQLIGIARPQYLERHSRALALLGAEAAMHVSGEEGLDEISISGPTQIVTQGLAVPTGRIVPGDAGLPCHPAEDLRGGDAATNAAALQRLLAGEHGAYRDTVLLNSAAALLVSGKAEDWVDGTRLAAQAIDSGAAKALLDRWIAW